MLRSNRNWYDTPAFVRKNILRDLMLPHPLTPMSSSPSSSAEGGVAFDSWAFIRRKRERERLMALQPPLYFKIETDPTMPKDVVHICGYNHPYSCSTIVNIK